MGSYRIRISKLTLIPGKSCCDDIAGSNKKRNDAGIILNDGYGNESDNQE